ncbi:hypothetical protein [Helicobacter suis]|uniref:hypothetical protein n=1 Tax=Helicobacter suis TaxID=104628 RepID=UPI0013D7B99C|nr:hypothetical protein [Helicobacter suis]
MLNNHSNLLKKDKREIANQLSWSIIKESGPVEHRKKVFQALLLYFLASPIFGANEIKEGWITKLNMSGNDVINADLETGSCLFRLTDIELEIPLSQDPVANKIAETLGRLPEIMGSNPPEFNTLQASLDEKQTIQAVYQIMSQKVSQEVGMDQEQMIRVLFQALSQVIPQEIGRDKERLSKFLSTSTLGKLIGLLSGLLVVDNFNQLSYMEHIRRELFGKDYSRRRVLGETLQTEAYDFGKLVCLTCVNDLRSVSRNPNSLVFMENLLVDRYDRPLKYIGEGLFITRSLKFNRYYWDDETEIYYIELDL